jgi:serine/threonine protein phosphatase PrpC
MEDRVLIDSFDECHAIAVLDGHSGSKTVNYVTKRLVSILKQTRISNTRQWLKAAFRQLHEETKHMRDGTTISLLLVVDKDLWLAYLGDSSVIGISVREHKIQRLTTEHKPHHKKEQAKLASSDYKIEDGYLTKPDGDGIAMTRSLGDAAFGHLLNREPTIHHLRPVWDIVALCSDGVTDVIKPATLFRILATDESSWEDSAKRVNSLRNKYFDQHDNSSLAIVYLL